MTRGRKPKQQEQSMSEKENVEDTTKVPDVMTIADETPVEQDQEKMDHLTYSAPTFLGAGQPRVYVTVTCAANRGWALSREVQPNSDGITFLSDLTEAYFHEYGEPIDQVSVRLVYTAHDRGRVANSVIKMNELVNMAKSEGSLFQKLQTGLVSLI